MNARTEEMKKNAAKRGTKRTCDSDDCGRRFYDLNIQPTDCPYCGAAFVVPVKKVVEARSYVSRSPPKVYKIQHEIAETSDALPEAEVAAVEIDEEELADPAAEEIPETDEDGIDEELAVEIKDRGEG